MFNDIKTNERVFNAVLVHRNETIMQEPFDGFNVFDNASSTKPVNDISLPFVAST